MKKTIAILLVAVLAAGSVFAGISGEGKIAYGYDLDSKNTGFTNSTNLKVNVDLATASEEKQAEGAIYAAVKGDLTLKLYNGAKGDSTDDPMAWGGNTGLDFIAISNVSATINGADWSVDILNSGKQLDLAKSAIDSSTKSKQLDSYGKKLGDKTDATTYKVGFNAAPGFTVTYKGYSVGLGFQYKDANSPDTLVKVVDGHSIAGNIVKYYKGTDFSLVAKTPEIAVTDEIKVQAGASFYNNETASVTIGTKSSEWKTVFDKFKTNRGSEIGGSVAVSYANDSMSAKVAADLGYAIKAYKVEGNTVATGIVENKDAEKFGMDLAANFTMDPVAVDAYYKYDGTKKDAADANYLSLQVKTDLNAFDVPVVLTVYGKDLFRFTPSNNKFSVPADPSVKPWEYFTGSATFGLKADVAVMSGLTINAETSITPKMVSKDAESSETKFIGWSAKAGAKFDADLFTVEGGLKLSNAGFSAKYEEDATFKQLVNKVVLAANAKVSSTTLVPGATLALEYSADDLLNSLDGDYKKANELTTYGSVTASCKVAF